MKQLRVGLCLLLALVTSFVALTLQDLRQRHAAMFAVAFGMMVVNAIAYKGTEVKP